MELSNGIELKKSMFDERLLRGVCVFQLCYTIGQLH